jgi:SAM-dependent methyltransferase
VEPDSRTKPQRDQLSWLTQFQDIAAIGDQRFDVVCIFHVLEHILDPLPFLQRCISLLHKGGRLIIEVPSLDDPLVSLYDLPTYKDFFFQKQHPYYYSAPSLGRMIDALGSRVEALISHQRYGLENHLNWLRNNAPGGDAGFRQVFTGADASYRKSLEDSGHADAVIAIVTAG